MSDIKEKFKRIAKNESPEVLATLMESMAEHIESQKKTIAKLEAENKAKDQQSFNIEEKLKLIKRSLYGKSSEVRPEASDRPREKSQSDNLLFSQAMFPTNEVRDESGKTIKTRWENLETQEVEVDIYPNQLEEEARLRLIEKHAVEKWTDLWEEIPNAFERITQIEIIERKYIKKIYKRKKYKLKEHYTSQVIVNSVDYAGVTNQVATKWQSHSRMSPISLANETWVSRSPQYDSGIKLSAPLEIKSHFFKT